MKLDTQLLWIIAAGLAAAVAIAGSSKDPFGTVPAERRETVENRLALYVKENRTHDWSKLYDLVSDKGRGAASRETFVTLMKESHGKKLAIHADLLKFQPDRATAREDGGFDIYGCAKARHEGKTFNVVAVAHAVFEHNDWFFTGWTLTGSPNEPCQSLTDPSWKPPAPIGWDRPMEELRPLP
jgi:hypothetical protein